MAEQPRNGYDPTRLDRIERLVEVLVNEHISLAEDHRLFAEEHKKLLIAQVVLTDRVDKLAASTSAGFAEHKQAMREFDERLNALIVFIAERDRKGPRLE